MDEDSLSSIKPLYQRPWVVGAVVAVVAIGVCGLALVRGGLLKGHRFHRAKHQPLIGMALIHARLFPGWLVAESGASDAATRLRAEGAYRRLRAAVKDPQLQKTLASLHTAALSPHPDGHADAVDSLFERWDARLTKLGKPYYVDGMVLDLKSGPRVLGNFYRVLDRSRVRVQHLETTRTYPALLLKRIDSSNLFEGWLGATPDDVDIGTVITDRVLDFCLNRLLPVLHPSPDWGLSPEDVRIAKAFAPKVRAELRQALGARRLAILEQVASWRVRLEHVVRAVAARSRCGSTFGFSVVPWDGFSAHDLDLSEAVAKASRLQPCPAITFEEADTLRDASEKLQTPEVKEAVEHLVAWASRGVAVHETRHAADHALVAKPGDPLACPACPAWMGAAARGELSAYTASFAWSDNPITTMYQACVAAVGGAHGEAMQVLMGKLGRTCADGPPAQLQEKARALELQFFQHSDRITLPAGYPTRVSVDSDL